MGIEFRRGVRGARIKRRGLPLRDLLHLAEQLGGRCLVKTGLASQAEDADGFEQAQSSESIGIGGIFRGLERNLHVRLRREIVDLVRLRLLDDANDVGRVGHIPVVQMERHAFLVRIVNELVDAFRIERRRASFHAVDDISLGEKKLGKIGAVLPGYAGDQRYLARRSSHHRSPQHMPFQRECH